MIESDAELLSLLHMLETELHRSTTRRDVERLGALLHRDFIEFGYSGSTYAKADILACLPLESGTTGVVADRFELARLSPTLALLTYRSAHVDDEGRRARNALRSSIWEHTEGAWQMRFHQGTPSS